MNECVYIASVIVVRGIGRGSTQKGTHEVVSAHRIDLGVGTIYNSPSIADASVDI